MTGGIYNVHLRALINTLLIANINLEFLTIYHFNNLAGKIATGGNSPENYISELLVRGHFRLQKTLTFKTRLSAKPLL